MHISRVLIEEKALEYPVGQRVHTYFSQAGVRITLSKRPVMGNDPALSASELYRYAKSTLVVAVKRVGMFETCKPSAEYQLPLFSGCGGMCEYCYLHTRAGTKPYLKLFVNTDDILGMADKLAGERMPAATSFEASASSDPVYFEPFSGVLGDCIRYFGTKDTMCLRVATKFDGVEPFLSLPHNGHTAIRFSVNAPSIASQFEHGVPPVDRRIHAAARMAEAGYPTGFMIAPIFLFEGWQDEYGALLTLIREQLPGQNVTFELVTHRFTARAKQSIQDIFPATTLDMDEGRRVFKFGQFGYSKYVYTKEEYAAMRGFFIDRISSLFGKEALIYLV